MILCMLMAFFCPFSNEALAQDMPEKANGYVLTFAQTMSNYQAKMLCLALDDLDASIAPNFSQDLRALTVRSNKDAKLGQILELVSSYGIPEPSIKLHGAPLSKPGSNVLITYNTDPKG